MKNRNKPAEKIAQPRLNKTKGGGNRLGKNRTAEKKMSQGRKPAAEKTVKLFPVVAIGASAGGIEAISKLLENLSPSLGMAYVIIQHLSPDHESILPDLLERKTKMPVHQVDNATHIRPDNVYVIPPNTYMSIEDSQLKLSPRVKTDGSYHSIDFFLNSLAAAYKNKAIAVILSGIATDGTVGIQSIKAEGGVTFAQNTTAKFQGMPKSAVDSGFIDFVLSPEAIAKQLEAFPDIIDSFTSDLSKSISSKIREPELKMIYSLLLNKKGVDFSYYKPSTINRRILRRMVLNRITEPRHYVKLLQQNTDELDLLYKDLLINVTSFFRDESSYETLTKKIFPVLLRDRKLSNPLRIWIPACSSGEEAYSIAILLFEYLKDKAVSTPMQVFATDLSDSAIERARSGVYPKGAMENIPEERLKKYFLKTDGSYQIIKPIRDICIFATHDLLKDPPFSRIDLISCQNVMIYLESAPQKNILQAFHYALKPQGYLLLGKSESIGHASDLFTQVGRDKIYVKKNTDFNIGFDFSSRSYYPLPEREERKRFEPHLSEVSIDKETEKILLSRYVPATLLVDKDLNIERFIGPTSQFLQPAGGKASLNLLRMVSDELVFDMRTLMHQAKKTNRVAKKEGVLMTSRAISRKINIEVVPVKSSRDFHYLIVLREIKMVSDDNGTVKTNRSDKRDPKDKSIAALESQLTEAREQLKMMSEDFEATREELQSSSEEILSSNEELQSINEEIETSKEELQSANEELTTINEELQRRNDELKEAVDFSQAVLQTIEEPLIVLGTDMRVKMANKAFYSTFETKDDAVDGRNFFEINNYQWDVEGLKKKLGDVFTDHKNFEQFELRHVFPLLGEKMLKLNAIRITKDDPKKNGVLLVLEDITQRRTAELKLGQSEERFRLLVQNASDIITILSPEGVILYESEPVENILGYAPKERVGKNIFIDAIAHPADVAIKEQAFKKALSRPNEKVKVMFRLKHKAGGYRDMEAVFVNFVDDPRIGGVVANYHDITERKILEQQKDEFIGIASHELKTPVTSIKAYTQILQDMFGKANDKKSVEMLDKMNGQVDRLTRLIVDLLDFTRIEGGELKFEQENYDLNDLVSEVVEEMQRTTKKHKIEKKLDITLEMHGDREGTGQVLTNLLNNAIKYSPAAKKIVVSSQVNKQDVTICVRDFGIGIEKEFVDKVFGRFFRVTQPAMNTFPGLGLGLYIAGEIVRRQGGKIWAQSEKDKGSSFYISLPKNGAGH